MFWFASASCAVSVRCLLPSNDSRARFRSEVPNRIVNQAIGGAIRSEPSVSLQL